MKLNLTLMKVRLCMLVLGKGVYGSVCMWLHVAVFVFCVCAVLHVYLCSCVCVVSANVLSLVLCVQSSE